VGDELSVVSGSREIARHRLLEDIRRTARLPEQAGCQGPKTNGQSKNPAM